MIAEELSNDFFGSAFDSECYLPEEHWFYARLAEFKDLEKGWDSYDAEPPDHSTITQAEFFVDWLLSNDEYEPSRLDPSVVGGIGFTFEERSGGRRSAYVEFRNTGNAHASLMGKDRPQVFKVTQNEDGFKSLLTRIKEHFDRP